MIRAVAAFLLGAAACTAAGALAQAEGAAGDAPPCTAPGALPADLAGWAGHRAAVQAAGDAKAAGSARLPVGQAVDATLLPTPALRYAVAPGKPGGSVSHGGMFAFDVAAPGTYRVSLGSHAWVDVVEGGKALTSVAHGHGPACTTLAKMVDYRLRPGRHLLQIAANGEPGVAVMVSRRP